MVLGALPNHLLRLRARSRRSRRRYPYPFIDIEKIGIERALLNALVIGVLFVIAGHLIVWIDRRLPLGLPMGPAKAPIKGI